MRVHGRWKKRRPPKIPFSCCHCDFAGNNANELARHKREMDSLELLKPEITRPLNPYKQFAFVLK